MKKNDMTKKVAVAMINYRREEKLIETLRTLAAGTGVSLHLVLQVQGGDTLDENVKRDILKKAAAFASNDIWFTPGNLGTGAPRYNSTMRAYENRPDYILILDSDMVVPAGTVERLIREIEQRPGYGAIAAWCEPDYYQWAIRDNEIVHLPLEREGFYDSEVLGTGCVIIRPEVFDKARFDNDLFIGWVDYHWSRAVVQAGWKLGVVAENRYKPYNDNRNNDAVYKKERWNQKEITRSYLKFKKKWGLTIASAEELLARMKRESRFTAEDTEPRVIFIHVNKAGGSTFKAMLERRFPRKEQQYDTYGAMAGRVAALKVEEDRHRYRLIRGHMGFGLHRFLDGPSTYITFLRRPVDRIISLYYHFSRVDRWPICRKIKEENMQLTEFAASGLMPQLSDWQTRIFASDTGIPVLPKEQARMDSSHLERAKEHLQNHVQVAGLTEHFDASLFLIQKKLNWKHLKYRKENVTENRPFRESQPPEVFETIARHNAMDLELYRFAEELFHRELAAYGVTVDDAFDFEVTPQLKLAVLRRIDELPENRSIVIYGAGEHTRKLYAHSAIGGKNVIGIVDSGKSGEECMGFTVQPPFKVPDMNPGYVIVSSFAYQNEIAAYLTKRLQYRGRIVSLYNDDDFEPFYTGLQP